MRALRLRRWDTKLAAAGSAALVLVGLALAAAGFSIWFVIAFGSLPWLALLSRRVGFAVALFCTLTASTWLILFVLMLTAATGSPMLGTVLALWAVIGFAGAVVLFIVEFSFRSLGRVEMLRWLPSLLGPIVWLGAVGATVFVAGAARYSIAMTGDAANNLLFARRIIEQNGISTGSAENPVPLPTALIALSMSVGRSATPARNLLQHDIGGFVILWVLLIALTCYLAGALAARMLRAHPWIAGTVGALASLIPLTWYATGYPLEYGFLNAELVFPIVFGSWLMVITIRRAPLVVCVSLLLASTLLLSVWSPLAPIDLGLALIVVVANWDVFVRVRKLRLVGLILAIMQLVAYALIVTLPGFVAQGHLLSNAGAVYPFSKLLIVGVLLGGAVITVYAFLGRQYVLAWVLTALLAACAIGLGALLFLNRGLPTLWNYYPEKFAWLTEVIGLVIFPSALLFLIVNRFPNRVVAILSITVLTLGTVGIANFAPREVPTYTWMNPIDRVLAGKFLGDGDQTAKRIFALSNPSVPTILWRSANKDESSINFWLIELRAGINIKSLRLREYAYANLDDAKTSELCSIVKLMHGRITVRTADVTLQQQLLAECPQARVRVVVSATATK